MTISERRLRGARRQTVPGTGQNANWDSVHDLAPRLPVMQLREIVCPHQPNKTDFGVFASQRGQRLGGMPRAKLRLDVGHIDPRMRDQRLRQAHTIRQRRRRTLFQGVSRAHHPPYGVQTKLFQRFASDMHMPRVRRVKRPPEQANSLARIHPQSAHEAGFTAKPPATQCRRSNQLELIAVVKGHLAAQERNGVTSEPKALWAKPLSGFHVPWAQCSGPVLGVSNHAGLDPYLAPRSNQSSPFYSVVLCCEKVQRRADGNIVADFAQKDKFFKLIA